jgi:rhodanese-related sulfurtransferase
MGIFGCGRPKARRIRASEAHHLIQAGAQFLDVRNHREFKAGHAVGARNIALSTLPKILHTLDPDRPIVFICQSGMRAGRSG